jgi:putative GTP pyrophosphokinase
MFADDMKGDTPGSGMGPPLSPEPWRERYAALRPAFDALTSGLERKVRELLVREAIVLSQMEARTKDPASFAEKLSRKAGKYSDPLQQMTDLVALRVIVYYPHDVERVGALIKSEFEIDWENSVQRGADDPPDRFGYRSDHYIVRLNDLRMTGLESQLRGVSAEIQVRTVMQHAWAAVDHRIRYKASDLPRDLSRRLFRLSALLEVADEQFAGLQEASNERSASYAEALAQGDLTVAVNALSLVAYLDKTAVGARWATRAVDAGYRELPLGDDSGGGEDVERLLRTLEALGISRLSELEGALTKIEDVGSDALRRILRNTREHTERPPPIWAFPGDVLAILFLAHVAPASVIEASGFRPEIRAALLEEVSQRDS